MPRVLVIDDDLMLSRVLEEHLSNEGFEVLLASMAEEGFEKARTMRPHLIMLDVQLPDATGFQTCGKLRQHPATRFIPIIMMTGTAKFPNQQSIGRQMGANDYILKPFNVIEVGDKIHAMLGTARPVQPSETDGAPDFKKESPPSWMRKDPSLLNLEFDHSSSRNGFKNPKIIFRPLEDEKLPLSAFQDISTTHAEPAPKIRIPMVPETPAETVTASPKETSLKIDPTPPAAWDNKPRLKFEVPFASPSIAEPVERPLPEPLKPTSMIPEETTEEFVQEEVLPLEESIDEPRPWPKLKFPHFKLPSLKLPQVAWPKLEPLNLKPLADFISLPSFTWTMFSSQVLLSMLIPVPKTDALHVGAFAAGTWVFLFGVILLDGLALKITLEAGDALRIMGQASIPLVLRSFLRLLGAFIPSLASLRALAVSNPLPITSFWVRPLDIFEIAALAVFGYALHRQPGSTFKKCLIAAASVALAAALADRGYFSPF